MVHAKTLALTNNTSSTYKRHQQQSELKDILVLMTIVTLARHGDHYFFEPGILMVSRFGMAVKGLFQRYTHVGPAHPGNNTHVSTTVFQQRLHVSFDYIRLGSFVTFESPVCPKIEVYCGDPHLGSPSTPAALLCCCLGPQYSTI